MAIVAAIAFAVLAALVAGEWSPLIELDHDLVSPFVEPSRDGETYREVMRAATFALNSQLIVGYAAVVAIGLAAVRRYAAGLWLAAVVGVGSLLNPLVKELLGRERPTVEQPVDTFDGLSFPSGHANSAALIALALLVVFWPAANRPGKIGLVAAAVVLPAFSGWTRLTLGGHYLFDVVGGALLALAWVAALAPLLPPLRRRLPEPER